MQAIPPEWIARIPAYNSAYKTEAVIKHTLKKVKMEHWNVVERLLGGHPIRQGPAMAASLATYD
jgi:hypothetical protein